MTAGPKDPPRIARALLDLLAGPADDGCLRGDLDEEFRRHVLPERGPGGAARWYWAQTLRSLPALLGRRLRGSPEDSGWLGARAADLRYALRVLARRPGGAVLVVLTFGLALGVNTSVFAVVQGVLLRPLPFAQADRMVRIHPDALFYVQLEGAQRFVERATAFDRVVPWGRTLFRFEAEGEAEEARGALVHWDHFQTLGARMALGRAFERRDAEVWPAESVILGHGLWVRRFGADSTIVGRRVRVSGRLRTVIGVTAPDHVPMEPDWQAWGPLPLDAALMEGSGLAINARLAPGVGLEDATRDARDALVATWSEGGERISDEEAASIRVVPLRDHLLGDVTRPLWILAGAVLGVLLLACANVANLLLARGERRAEEVAVRLSLGASRRRVAAELLTEVGVLALLGGLLGLGLAGGVLTWASGRLPVGFPRGADLGMGLPALSFAGVAMAASALLSGLVPVARTLRVAARPGGGAIGPRGLRTRSGSAALLLGTQIAVAVLLLVGSGLLARSFLTLRTVDPGFDASDVVAARMSPPGDRYDGPGSAELFDRIRRDVEARPEFSSAGGIMFLPMTPGGAWSRYRARLEDPVEDATSAHFRVVTPGYLETLGIPVLSGRSIETSDDAGAVPVAVVNRSFARLLFGDEEPVGRRIHAGGGDEDPLTVVGVVGDVRQTDLRREAVPEVHMPLAQRPFRRMWMLARTTGDPTTALEALRSTVHAVDRDIVLTDLAPMTEIVGATLSEDRLLAQLLGLFAVVALLVGVVGVYGVAAHAVSRQRREIGIRLALGQDGSGVAGRVIGRGLFPVLLGAGVGLGGAALAAPVLGDILYGIGTRDPLVFVGVPAILGLTSLVALGVPAIRAARMDPVTSLREEG